MGVGELILVSIGKENIYLSADPEITFFKIVYKRHTNFSIEPTPQYFKTTPDFGRRCTVNISKNSDLLGNVDLYIELPTIPQETHSILPRGIKKFSWVNKPGLALIDYVEFEVGGDIIERQYADYLNIWYELMNSYGHYTGYDKMIGNIEEMTSLTNGKDNKILYIPLNFWFCQDSGLALPLVALQHSDVKIHVKFNDFNKCYKESPNAYINVNENFCIFREGELFRQNYNGTISIGRFVYFDAINKILYYDTIKGSFSIPTTENDTRYILTGDTTNYKINIKANSRVVNDENYFKLSYPAITKSYLIVNYIYLDNFERYYFIDTDHEYLVPITQNLPEQTVFSATTSYKLDFVNPIKFLIWRIILSSNYSNNNYFNYTTTPNTTTEQDTIINHKIIINSQEITTLDKPEHYTLLQNYQNQLSNRQRNIYTYSFSQYAKNYQPSGTLNMTQIDDAYLQLTLNRIINYQNSGRLRAYAISYNLFRITKGVGNIGFSN